MRLYKPQRLLSISLEEEQRRALSGWHSFDEALRLACFDDLAQLQDFCPHPQDFRNKVSDLVIFMSDQVPMWLKISPGTQLYAASEITPAAKGKKLRVVGKTGDQRAAQCAKTQCIRDDEEVSEDENEGMTQLRGENSADQDKFRITVDLEQRVLGWCSETSDPQFEWGRTSVIFTGTHCRLSNISEAGTWKETETFHVDGKEIVRRAGNQVPEKLAQTLRDLRARNRDLFSRLEKLKVEIYQQPAGFEDSVITAWKIERQAQDAPVSIGLRDMFAGGLSETALNTCATFNQLPCFIRGKMTAAVQAQGQKKD